MQQRGLAHESAYLEHLQRQNIPIANLRDIVSEADAFEETLTAMQKGADVIAQAVLLNSRWFGRADVLRKVPVPSKLGNWHEPDDDGVSASEDADMPPDQFVEPAA